MLVQVRAVPKHRSTHISNYQSTERESYECDETSLTIIPMCPRERFSHYKKLSRLVLCYKKDWATLLHYNKGYYLADSIYPRWSTFVKTISNLVPGGKNAFFAKVQEACRKDVEWAFGVLQSGFAVVRYPAQTWLKDQIQEIMTCCVILHNMIIESEQEEPVFDTEPYYR